MDREALLKQLDEDAEAQLLREAEERRFLYHDVEKLIEDGFLTHTLVVDGVSVVLRSFLPSDFHRLQARVALAAPDAGRRWRIAASVWMVNGYELSLEPRDNAAWMIYDSWVQDMPGPVVDVLYSIVIGFENRVRRSIRLIEAFCYEQYSRGLWRMLGRSVEGLSNANVVRRMWVAYNLVEDQNHLDEQQWAHTKAIVGSMTNKGAKHIGQQLTQFAEKEKQRRQRVIEDAVNWIIRGDEERAPITITVNGREIEVPRIHSAQTTQDLEVEMRRVFTGDQDLHDYLVDQYQKNVREQVNKRREEAQRALLEARQRSEAAEMEGSSTIVGYTKEQLAQHRPDIKQRTTSTVHQSAQSNYLFDRYFNPELRPGVLTPSLQVEDPSAQDRRVLGRQEVDEEPAPEPTLQEKIAARTPTLKGP